MIKSHLLLAKQTREKVNKIDNLLNKIKRKLKKKLYISYLFDI